MIVRPAPLELRLAMPLGSFEAHASFQLWVQRFRFLGVEMLEGRGCGRKPSGSATRPHLVVAGQRTAHSVA